MATSESAAILGGSPDFVGLAPQDDGGDFFLFAIRYSLFANLTSAARPRAGRTTGHAAVILRWPRSGPRTMATSESAAILRGLRDCVALAAQDDGRDFFLFATSS